MFLFGVLGLDLGWEAAYMDKFRQDKSKSIFPFGHRVSGALPQQAVFPPPTSEERVSKQHSGRLYDRGGDMQLGRTV